MPAPNSKELLALVERGESHAASIIFDRYVERLIALVRKRIGPKLARRIDPEDVVQSTYRSFFAHAENEEYQVTNSGDLWRLLASIALHKLYGQIEKHTAARRNIAREAADNLLYPDFAARDPGAAEVVAITEQLQLINKRLTAAQRDVLTRYLQGDSVDAIAAHQQKATRTIRRLLAECREEFERQLLPNASHRNQLDEQSRRELDARAPLKYTDYVLERLIGAGGMGKVYRAKHLHTGEQVAIKTLHKASQRDRRVVEKFLQEADILARLAHPNIVKFHGVGRFPGGGYFLVMGFIDGTDLQARLNQAALPAAEAVSVVSTVAEAIAFAHSHGIVHGDLKPANVLLDHTNRVVVTDFGLAQFIAEPNKPALIVGGTAGYIAPEVCMHGHAPGPSADIYALGAMLIVLLTGMPPRRSDSSPTVAIADPALNEIGAKCLAADPADRFQSPRQLIEAFNNLFPSLVQRG